MQNITVRDATATALWRFHNAAMERAVLIYTFARSTGGEPGPGDIHSRQLVMLLDLVHEFCFSARKAIERADKYRPGTVTELQSLKIHFDDLLRLSPGPEPRTVPLSKESLWWLLGRIIHSKDTSILYREIETVVYNSRTGAHYTIEQPVGFSFASDRDSAGQMHHLQLESLANAYTSRVAPMIEEAIASRNGLPYSRNDA